jgi:hypothetical protein
MSEAQAIGPVPAPVDVIVGSSTIQQVVLVEVFAVQGMPGPPGTPGIADAADVIAALGYTPANKAGDTFGGNVVAPALVGNSQVYSPGYGTFQTGVYPTPTARYQLGGDGGTYADVTFDADNLARIRYAYASKMLVYYVANVPVFSVDQAGNVIAKGAIVPNGTPAMFEALGVPLPDPDAPGRAALPELSPEETPL